MVFPNRYLASFKTNFVLYRDGSGVSHMALNNMTVQPANFIHGQQLQYLPGFHRRPVVQVGFI